MAAGDYSGARILIVDDEEANVILLERMLTRAGYTRLTSTQDSRRVLQLVEETNPDLILLDLLMPHLDGYAVMSQLQETIPGERYLPILVLTADVTPQALQRALSGGARDFLTKPFDQTELLLRVRNLLETRYLYLALQKQLDTLEHLNAEAREAITSRDESLSTISHDIGQPLAALRLTAETLQDILRETGSPEKEQLSEDVNRIGAATSEIAAMISEMSDTARLQMGRALVLQRRDVDLVKLVRQQIATAQASSKRHRIRLNAKVDEAVGNWDPMRLARVLSNLLANAIKFSANDGEIVVIIDSQPDGGTARISVSVTDRGLGIPETDLAHVFEPFYRAGNAARVEGTGIGLASAKQIIEQHGGSIAVESEEGHGTTVTFFIPA